MLKRAYIIFFVLILVGTFFIGDAVKAVSIDYGDDAPLHVRDVTITQGGSEQLSLSPPRGREKPIFNFDHNCATDAAWSNSNGCYAWITGVSISGGITASVASPFTHPTRFTVSVGNNTFPGQYNGTVYYAAGPFSEGRSPNDEQVGVGSLSFTITVTEKPPQLSVNPTSIRTDAGEAFSIQLFNRGENITGNSGVSVSISSGASLVKDWAVASSGTHNQVLTNASVANPQGWYYFNPNLPAEGPDFLPALFNEFPSGGHPYGNNQILVWDYSQQIYNAVQNNRGNVYYRVEKSDGTVGSGTISSAQLVGQGRQVCSSRPVNSGTGSTCPGQSSRVTQLSINGPSGIYYRSGDVFTISRQLVEHKRYSFNTNQCSVNAGETQSGTVWFSYKGSSISVPFSLTCQTQSRLEIGGDPLTVTLGQTGETPVYITSEENVSNVEFFTDYYQDLDQEGRKYIDVSEIVSNNALRIKTNSSTPLSSSRTFDVTIHATGDKAGGGKISTTTIIPITINPLKPTVSVSLTPPSQTVTRPRTGTQTVTYTAEVFKQNLTHTFTPSDIHVFGLSLPSPTIVKKPLTKAQSIYSGDVFDITFTIAPDSGLIEDKQFSVYAVANSNAWGVARAELTIKESDISSPQFSLLAQPETLVIERPKTGTAYKTTRLNIRNISGFASRQCSQFKTPTSFNAYGPSGGPADSRAPEGQVIGSWQNNPDGSNGCYGASVQYIATSATPLGTYTYSVSVTGTSNLSGLSTKKSIPVRVQVVEKKEPSLSVTLTPDKRTVSDPNTGDATVSWFLHIEKEHLTHDFGVNDIIFSFTTNNLTNCKKTENRGGATSDEYFTITCDVSTSFKEEDNVLLTAYAYTGAPLGLWALDEARVDFERNPQIVGKNLAVQIYPSVREKDLSNPNTTSEIATLYAKVGRENISSIRSSDLSVEHAIPGVSASISDVSSLNCLSISNPPIPGARVITYSCHKINFSIDKNSAQEGRYSFILRVSKEGALASDSAELILSNIPTPTPTPTPTPMIDPLSCSLSVNPNKGVVGAQSNLGISTNGGLAPYNYRIDADGDGDIDAYDSTTSFTYTSSGIYTAQGYVEDAIGNTSSCSETVRIYEPISCTISATPEQGIIPFLSTLSLSTSGGYGSKTYRIDANEDGINDIFSPSGNYTYADRGEYTVRGSVSDSSGNAICTTILRAYQLGGREINPGGN